MAEVIRKLRTGYVIMREESAEYVEIQIVNSGGMRHGQPLTIRKPHVDPISRKLRTATVNWFSGTKTEWEVELFLKALEVAADEVRVLNNLAFVSDGGKGEA